MGSSFPGLAIQVPVMRSADSADLPVPGYATRGSAGADLHAAVTDEVIVRHGEIVLVPTGLHLAIPEGWEGQVRPRSGLAVRHGLTVVNSPGTIDSDYRGEIKVVLTCLADEPCVIRRGDRIAQIVFCPVGRATFESVGSLPDTQRGSGGFGHTGTRAGN